MNRIITFSTALLISVAAGAQNSIADVLRSVEQNNLELKANERQVAAQRAEDKTDNNLPDPTVSYEHVWQQKNTSETVGELTVTQGFDFPTLYAGRNSLNRKKSDIYNKESDQLRQSILLQAKEVCLDIIMLHKQQAILDERMKNALELTELYKKRIATGDANIIDMNKLNLEVLNVKSEALLNASTLVGKEEELNKLNGGIDIKLSDYNYVEESLPADFETLRAEVLPADPSVAVLNSQYDAAQKAVSVSKQGWLPQLEVGYRRNNEAGTKLNGAVAGFSIPLFQNRGKVKAAKAQRDNIGYLRDNALETADAELRKNYEEALTLRTTIGDYSTTLNSQRDLDLLRQALDGGQMGFVDYFVEVAFVFQTQQNFYELENRYQKLLAQIYRNRL
jgi:outer membrane protein TolC